MVDQRSPKRRKLQNDTEKTATLRPSYGAPTRASLSRFNPELLPEPRSSPRKSPRKAETEDLLSHVLGTKARRKSLPAQPTLLRASPPVNGQGAILDNVTQDDDELADAEHEHSIVETPTIEGGRYRDGDNVEDLPETPQHLRERPEYQDTPPRGVLVHSLRKAQSRNGRKSLRSSARTSPVISAEEKPADQAQPMPPQVSIEGKLRLKARRQELIDLKEELRKVEDENAQYERHITAMGNLSNDDEYEQLPQLLTLISQTHPDRQHQDSEVKLLPVSNLLTAFLPFSIPQADTTLSVVDEPVPSHAPLPDIPQLLGVFTPFQTSSVLSTPSEPTQSNPQITQLQTMTLSIPSMLSCTLALTTALNTSTNDPPFVSALKLVSLSPWVEREIGPWIRARAAELDIQGVGYGLGRYWEMNKKRARVWSNLSEGLAHLNPHAVNTADQLGETAQSNRKRRMDKDDELDLTLLLGRDAFVCGNAACEAMVRWHLDFDPIGDIESRISLRIKLGRQGNTTAGQKITQMARKSFCQLLEKYGVAIAVTQVVDAIFV